jgi:hypothetical protein
MVRLCVLTHAHVCAVPGRCVGMPTHILTRVCIDRIAQPCTHTCLRAQTGRCVSTSGLTHMWVNRVVRSHTRGHTQVCAEPRRCVRTPTHTLTCVSPSAGTCPCVHTHVCAEPMGRVSTMPVSPAHALRMPRKTLRAPHSLHAPHHPQGFERLARLVNAYPVPHTPVCAQASPVRGAHLPRTLVSCAFHVLRNTRASHASDACAPCTPRARHAPHAPCAPRSLRVPHAPCAPRALRVTPASRTSCTSRT